LNSTTAGARGYTPGYSPLEQYGRGKTDARSDVYALGATLYVLLTGQEPHESVQRVLDVQLQAAHQINPQISSSVGKAVQCALAVRQEDRHQTINAFKAALVTERVDILYQQAAASASHNDFASAETYLWQLFTFEPNHSSAQALWQQITQRRSVLQRYQALSLTVAQAKTEAAAIKQTDPNAADPDGVLRLLSSPVSPPVQPVASAQPVAVQESRRLQRISSAIVAAAVLIGVVGLALAQEALVKVLDTTASRELALGDLVIGVGLGLQVVALIALNAMSHRSSPLVVGISVVVAAASLIAIYGLSMATAAVFSVEKSLASANLGLGNFLMGLGIGAGASSVVLYFVARNASIP
jgi:hypothetical protein